MTYSPRQLKRLLDNELIAPRDMPHLASRVCETVVKRRVFAVEDKAVTWLHGQYIDLYRGLQSVATRTADDLRITKIEQTRAGQSFKTLFLVQAEPRIKALSDRIAADALRRATAAYVGGYVGRLWLMDTATRDDVRIRKDAPRNPIASALNLVREDVYDDAIRDLLGREWRDLYGTELDDLILRIRRALGSSMIEGEGIADAMRRVRTVIGVDTDRRRGFRANYARVSAITRTIIQQVSSTGAVDAYRANADVLAGYQWITARDERTCSQCLGLNGTVYKLGDSYRPPAHPQCRCTVVPVIRDDLLIPSNDPPRQTLEDWTRSYGMDAALASFLIPAA